MNEVRVRINPAGFTFVRYVLIHFEFYSNIVMNKGPLFVDHLSTDPNQEDRYLFETKIDNVIRMVRIHIRSMEQFFKLNYSEAGVDANRFRRSRYCFRHLGNAAAARSVGYFHLSRVITSHIDYIDYFRLQTVNKFVNDDSELVKINRLLITKIQIYVQMLKMSMDDRARKDFVKHFDHEIQKVIRSGYRDKKTRIKIRNL